MPRFRQMYGSPLPAAHGHALRSGARLPQACVLARRSSTGYLTPALSGCALPRA
ncbi:hypothetical protein [Spongiactinospora sp. 9N601]|uniref:hypothetical protein n=1 Tax=Spongiactinospora sp. 9N601 TaxID=3375149 RepID=UPI0037B5162D